MTGVDLFDAYTRASKELPSCCVKTLNAAVDVHPSARELLKTRAEGGAIVATLECKTCGRTWNIRVERGAAKVTQAAKAAG
jgi:hypothetical protein